jgi:hypothetical protein
MDFSLATNHVHCKTPKCTASKKYHAIFWRYIRFLILTDIIGLVRGTNLSNDIRGFIQQPTYL